MNIAQTTRSFCPSADEGSMAMDHIEDAVIVITGASSGIGRATALHLARQGARLALASRQDEALEELARQCEALGGKAIAVPTDVTDEQAVLSLARQTVDHFGPLGAWINNAAVSVFGTIEQIPMDSVRRVIETNLIGYIHGVRAALPYLRAAGGGVIINVSSVIAKAAQPYTIPYSVSKCGISGLSEALRMELQESPEAIHVCTILPPSVDTPVFQHAGNFSGSAVRPMDPIYPASRIAHAIADCLLSPRREVTIGPVGPMMSLIHNVAPARGDRFFARKVREEHLIDEPAPASRGNVFEPDPSHNTVSGGWLPDHEDSEPEASGDPRQRSSTDGKST
jgi:NAD(P)-dependent dehydrogenase (short-subunit alcohol dehydrogenase family)